MRVGGGWVGRGGPGPQTTPPPSGGSLSNSLSGGAQCYTVAVPAQCNLSPWTTLWRSQPLPPPFDPHPP